MPSRPPVHRALGWRPYVKPASSQTAYYNTPEWRRLRIEALERDGYRCTWLEHGVRCAARAVTPHHVIPRSAGGPDALSNLRSLCASHHNAAHPEKGRR